MPPLGAIAAAAALAFVLGGLIITLMKFPLDPLVLLAFLLLGAIITTIALALRSVIGWLGFFPTLFFAGMLVFTAAFLA